MSCGRYKSLYVNFRASFHTFLGIGFLGLLVLIGAALKKLQQKDKNDSQRMWTSSLRLTYSFR